MVAGGGRTAGFGFAGDRRPDDRALRHAHVRRRRIRCRDRRGVCRYAVVRRGGRRAACVRRRYAGVRRGGGLSGGLQRDGGACDLYVRGRQRLHRNPPRPEVGGRRDLPPDLRDHETCRRRVGDRGGRGGRRTRVSEIRRVGGMLPDGRRVDSSGADDRSGAVDGRSEYRPPHAACRTARGVSRRAGLGEHAAHRIGRRTALLAGLLRARFHPSRRDVRAHGGQHDDRKRFDRLLRPAHALPRTGLRGGQRQRDRQRVAGHVHDRRPHLFHHAERPDEQHGNDLQRRRPLRNLRRAHDEADPCARHAVLCAGRFIVGYQIDALLAAAHRCGKSRKGVYPVFDVGHGVAFGHPYRQSGFGRDRHDRYSGYLRCLHQDRRHEGAHDRFAREGLRRTGQFGDRHRLCDRSGR